MAIEIIEQFRIFRNEPLLTRDSVATIADRNNIPVEERFNGIKTIVRSEGKRYEIIYSGNFNSLSTAAKNAFLADNNNWKEVVSNAALDLKEDKINKGAANGYTPLGADTKIPLQFIPDSLLGALEYKGVWDATTNTAPHGSPENGWYYKVNVAGQTTFTGSTVDWAIGDWIIYNGTTWDRVANADKVISVNGQEGEVIINDSNLEHEPAVSIPTWISSVYTAGKAAFKGVFDAIITRIGIMDTQLVDIEDKLDTIEEGANNYSPPDYFGDVEILETGETIINNGVVKNSHLGSMPANTFKGAISAGYPVNISSSQVKTMLSLPENTEGDLTAAQAAIDSLIQLVASDNFNLDTIQEIVDFIEANRTDLDTYISALENKVDKEAGKSLILLTDIAKLSGIEEGATADQTATEIRDLLITLTGTNRLPASAIKDIPQTTIVDNLNSQSATSALSANQGYVINQNLIAKQNAIDALQALVASDNFDLDTVQEIVDFIEQNRTDLDTYIANLPTASSLAGLGLTANGNKIDFGGSIGAGQEVYLATVGGGKMIFVADGANSEMQYLIANNGKVAYKFNDGTGEVKFGDSGILETIMTEDLFQVINKYDLGFGANFQAGMYKLESIVRSSGGGVNISRVIQEIISEGFADGSTPAIFKIQKTVEHNDSTPDKITGIDFTNDGPVLIGEPSDSPNALIRRSDLPTDGGTPTPIINNLTSDSTTSALAAAQGKVLNDKINQQFYLGYIRETQGVYDGDANVDVELNYYGFKQDIYKLIPYTGIYPTYTISINNGNPPNNIYWSGILIIDNGFSPAEEVHRVLLPVGSDSSGEYIEVNPQWGKPEAYKFHRSFNVTFWEYLGSYEDIGGREEDKTQVGTTITASRSLALTDTGLKRITPVNSASNVVLTIPADATLNMPIGSTINLRRRGAGSVEIIGAAGVTIEGIQDTNGDYKIVRYGIVSAYKEAANLWVVYGALES